MTCVCHSTECSSQFHVEIWCYCHVHLYKYIYYCYAKQLDVLWQISHVKYSSGYTYNWVSCKISKKIVMPYNMYVFSILPFILLWYLTYINPVLSTFFLIQYFMSWYMFVCCTYTMMYCICYVLQIYILEIYTLT